MVTPCGEATSKWELGREARATLLRVRTGPECPKGNLRELTTDSNPDCGISLYLRHHQARSQNKGLSRASPAHPPPVTGRLGKPEPEGGNRRPRETLATKLQAGFLANQDFLGFA